MSTIQIGQHHFKRDVGSGYYPVFSLELNRRVKNKEATNIVVVGEAGSGKSFTGIQLALSIDKRFGINQIIFNYKEYIEEIQHGKMGVPIVFDEPSYAMGKHEWYNQINRALVKTVESQRFLVRPLIIPIINLNLLDKTIRNYLIQFQVHVVARGKARVYRMHPGQHVDKVYRYLFCTIQYPILNPECSRGTCLGCRKLSKCDKLRAQYERKKAETQLGRYDEGLELASKLEASEITLDQMVELAHTIDDKLTLTTRGKRDIETLRYWMEERFGLKMGTRKADAIRTRLDLKYPKKTEN